MPRQTRLPGMIGGLGPIATIYYYERLVEKCRALCGHAPRLLIYTLPVEEMCEAARRGDKGRVASLLVEALRSLASGGAEVVFISANTPHIAWEEFRRHAEGLGVEPVSIVEAAVDEVVKHGYRRVAVLGTKALYETRIYQDALIAKSVEPVELPHDLLNRVDSLIQGLARGEVREGDVDEALSILDEVGRLGADAAVLACTELPALLRGRETPIPVVDTVEAQLDRVLERVTG